MTYLRTFLLTSTQINILGGLVLDRLNKPRPQVMKELMLIKLIVEGKI